MTTTDSLTNAGAKAGLTGNLARYYLVRAIVAAVWVAAAVAIGRSNATAAALLLVSYPAWDALANWFDAQNSGGLRTNLTQSLKTLITLERQAYNLGDGGSDDDAAGTRSVLERLSGDQRAAIRAIAHAASQRPEDDASGT